MSGLFIRGLGAVSPAGWGVPAMMEALRDSRVIPGQALPGPMEGKAVAARLAPAPSRSFPILDPSSVATGQRHLALRGRRSVGSHAHVANLGPAGLKTGNRRWRPYRLCPLLRAFLW